MNENIEYNIGDVVRLRSEGPKMTVHDISQNNLLECLWFDTNCMLQRELFKGSSLHKIPFPLESENKDDWGTHPNILILEASRIGDEKGRKYEFRYDRRDQVSNKIRINLPGGFHIVKIPLYQFRWQKNFQMLIVNSDSHCGPGGTLFPVTFKVTAGRWEN